MQGNFKTFRIALMLVLSLFVGTVSAQTITGNVVDETGEAVIGATVMEKGTKNATVTDFDGNFTIKMESGKVLTISYIGMQSQDVNVAGKTSVNVILKEDATTLQDVVVVGEYLDAIDNLKKPLSPKQKVSWIKAGAKNPSGFGILGF